MCKKGIEAAKALVTEEQWCEILVEQAAPMGPAFTEYLLRALPYSSFCELVAREVVDQLDDQEIDQLIEFHRTPLAKKLVGLQGALGAAAVVMINQHAPAAMAAAAARGTVEA